LPILRSNVAAYSAVGITNKCRTVWCPVGKSRAVGLHTSLAKFQLAIHLIWIVFHFIFSLSVTLQFIFILPFHQKHITQKEFPQVQPTLAYHTAKKIYSVTYQL
jgi:hypothetical protein